MVGLRNHLRGETGPLLLLLFERRFRMFVERVLHGGLLISASGARVVAAPTSPRRVATRALNGADPQTFLAPPRASPDKPPP